MGFLKIERGVVRYSQEDEGDDEPGSQEDSDGVGELARVTGVGSSNTKAGVKEGSVGQPETTVAGEG